MKLEEIRRSELKILYSENLEECVVLGIDEIIKNLITYNALKELDDTLPLEGVVLISYHPDFNLPVVRRLIKDRIKTFKDEESGINIPDILDMDTLLIYSGVHMELTNILIDAKNNLGSQYSRIYMLLPDQVYGDNVFNVLHGTAGMLGIPLVATIKMDTLEESTGTEDDT